MTISLCTRSNAIVEARVKNILRAFDNSVDVKEAIRIILEDLWNVALAAGVKSGVDSVHSGKFDAAIADIKKEIG